MTDRRDSRTNRRGFLKGAAAVGGGLLVLGCGSKKQAPPEAPAPAAPAPPAPAAPVVLLPDGLDPDKFHMHTRNPLTLETKRSSFGASPITPNDLFFVRNNLPMPAESIVWDPDVWEIEIGGVMRPRKVSVAELKQLRSEMITSVVQCSGNGRKFYQHGPSGSQWATGAAGCAMWTGVRVGDVVDMLGGVAPGAKYMTSTGGETLPEGVDPLSVMVERSILMEKGLKDCMLVWEMNGVPIPITHGGPLRLIVPGYYGCNQIKYIKRLAFTAEQTQAKIQKSGYRYRPIGEKGNPTQPSMWRMNVKSWVNGPGADDEPVLHGKVQFYGVALSGERGIAKVEVSMDEGATWRAARFVGPDLGPSAWRAFMYEADLPVGKHTIMSRATDDEGDTQPEARGENERGYGHNGWRDHALTVNVVEVLPPKPPPKRTVAAPVGGPGKAKDSAKLSARGKDGKRFVQTQVEPVCGACHTIGDAGFAGAVGPNLDVLKPEEARIVNAVTNGVGAMPPYKDVLSEEQIRLIARYVAEATQ